MPQRQTRTKTKKNPLSSRIRKPQYKSSIKKHSILYKKASSFSRPILQKRRAWLDRRSHHSFRLTSRRDYIRSLNLPGYWSFTNEVRRFLWLHKRLFVKFIVTFSVFIALTIGLMSQENYTTLRDSVNNIGETVLEGNVGQFGQNIAIFSGVLVGALNAPLSEGQQVYYGLLVLLGWLTMVWLLRQLMAGHTKLKLRDGIYSSASPLVSTFLIFLLILIQIIPFALALIAYGAAESVDVFDDTLFTTFFWIVEIILVTLSLYWLSSSLFAAIIITLPGMYPWQAIKAASDVVVGRRLRILYRILWMLFINILVWGIILIPIIFIDGLLKLTWLPLIPLTVLVLSSITLVFNSSYLYILYRKVVDNDE
jgi:hypothetical protein